MKAAPNPIPARESGWLPDCVHTGDKFEFGVAFFADALGRITRFSRDEADLQRARRLAGQAALPGLVNCHSRCLFRLIRGRLGRVARKTRELRATEDELIQRATSQLNADGAYETACMAFTEMLLSGITCVGEFLEPRAVAAGAAEAERTEFARALLRASVDVGIRLVLFWVAGSEGIGAHAPAAASGSSARFSANDFIRELDGLREFVARERVGDPASLGIGIAGLPAMRVEDLKTLAAYAHTHRLRLHVPVGERAAGNEANVAAHGRTPLALLAEAGLLEKRTTAIHVAHLTDDDVRLLGAARAQVCVCPGSASMRGEAITPLERLLAANVSLALGTGSAASFDLFQEARALDHHLRAGPADAVATLGSDASLLQCATAAGARSLGAPSGALEVGRPADFFTVNLYDPSLAGAEPDALLGTLLSSLQRRAIREVWVDGRQRISNGRHPQQGPMVGRFVELQRRLWRT